MHIDYQCSGGFAGLLLTYRGEIEQLPAEEAGTLMDLIESANVFDLNQDQISKKSRPVPDDYACRITLSTAGKTKTLSFNELSVPENLRRLSTYLRELAIKRRGT